MTKQKPRNEIEAWRQSKAAELGANFKIGTLEEIAKELGVTDALFYDNEKAALFIAARTSETLESVNTFVQARFHYQELNYLVDSEVDLTAEREQHADLITNSPESSGPPNEDENMLLRYIQRITRIERTTAASMIAEETAYMVSIGIIEPGAYHDSRSWADAIAQEEQEAEESQPVN